MSELARHPAPRVVLVRSLYGGNVGAAARAMANMGLSDLRIVQPQYEHEREVELMAKGAARILAESQTTQEIGAALGDCTVVVACTARPRRWKAWKVLDPSDSAALLLEHAARGEPVALMFGAEDSGLSQEELGWATHLCHIPTGPEHSSLNLSQAVLLLGWEWMKVSGGLRWRTARNRSRNPATIEQVNGAADQVALVLDRIKFFAGRSRAKSLATIRQTMLRGNMTDTEIHFLRGVVNKLRWWVDNGPRLRDEPPDADGG